MIVAYACIRTLIMYKCSKFVFCARNARNVKSQQLHYFHSNLDLQKFLCKLAILRLDNHIPCHKFSVLPSFSMCVTRLRTEPHV